MDIKQIYKDANALLEGHFLLSSGKHSQYYLQSAKVLENPQTAEKLARELAFIINDYGLEVDTVCSPALGGILAGYELARALNVRFIFAERVNGKMTLRRGFEVKKDEKILICEDIITTGGSAMEVAKILAEKDAEIVAFAALANRGICSRFEGTTAKKPDCKLPDLLPFFALEDFNFDVYEPGYCPLCKNGSKPIKPGSRS